MRVTLVIRRGVLSVAAQKSSGHWKRTNTATCTFNHCKRYHSDIKTKKMGDDIDFVVDFRSDTVTKPSQGMYQAMINAPVGDDVMSEDPTTLELQSRCAKMFNKEDALFVPTGTMGNLISIMVHCSERGKEVIMGKMNHMFLYEAGGLAQIAGVHTNTIYNSEDGSVDLNEVRRNIRDVNDDHMPQTRVICLENTQNRCGGLVIPVSYFEETRKLADEHGLAVHLDGARILHACAVQGVTPNTYTDLVDSVSMCFSKGLGAPVGSIIAGTADFCSRARRMRKVLGGGMRQVGVLAAAALYALDNNVERLKEDHDHAHMLAEVVAEHRGDMADVDINKVHTNIAYIQMMKPDILNATQFIDRMTKVTKEEKESLGCSISVKMLPFSETDVRFVCHINTPSKDVEMAAKKFAYVLKEINQ